MSAPIVLICGAAGSGKDTVAGLFAKYARTITIAQADPMKRLAAKAFLFSEHQLWGPSEARNAPDPRYNTQAWSQAEQRLLYHGFAWIENVLPDLSPEKQQYAFSDLMKWFGKMRDAHTLVDSNGDVRVLTARYMLQTLGTEWGRKFSPDMWNTYAIRTAKQLLTGGYTYSRVDGMHRVMENQATPDKILAEQLAGPEFVLITDGRFRNEVLGVQYINGLTIKIVNPKPSEDAAKVEAAGVSQHKSETELNGIPDHFYSAILVNDKAQGLLALENKVAKLVSIKRASIWL